MNMSAPSALPKTYSYVRFSTPQQALGDSLQRQAEKAAKWAADHGLTLDTTINMNDLGTSAFRQANAKKGALRRFLDAVEEGVVEKGSYLLVENMDRLSRDEIYQSLPLFLMIINSGITIVTLTDGKVYSQESLKDEKFQMFYIVAELTRANEESSRKSQLVADQKARKKQRLLAGGTERTLHPADASVVAVE